MESTTRTRALVLIAALSAASPRPAVADYVCTNLDVPGSVWTQVWQLNNVGDVAAGSSIGASIYSNGTWTSLPTPTGSGFTVADLGALGINDSGQIAGVAADPNTFQETGFLLTGSTYNFFSHLPATYPNTEPRALSNSGLVLGWVFGDLAGPAFVYNPGLAQPGYPTGFTDLVPVFNGESSVQTIPGAMNAAGQFVGSAFFESFGGKHAFIYDPSASPPFTFFRINGMPSAARGINDSGAVTGWIITDTGYVTGYLLTAAGYELFGCPDLGSVTDLFAESINNRNVISGFWDDPSGGLHGFIAYPNVVLPVGSQNGAFVFDVAVSPNTPVHLDPAVAVGYQYAVGDGNPLFASVNLPIGIGDNLYTLIVQRHAFTLPAGQRFDFAGNGFAGGVSAFEVLGIETSAGLDPANPRAFVTEVTFAAGGNGRFTGTMKPMMPGDELADLRDMVTGVRPGKSLASKMTTAETAYAAGSVPDTCAALADLISEVAAVSGKKLSTTFAGAITAEANAARAAVGCP